MKFKLLTVILLPFVLVAVFIFYFRGLLLPVSDNSGEVDFLINKGSSVAQIGNNLESAKLIRSGIAFKFYVQLTNNTNKIQAGEFQLTQNLSLVEMVDRLKKGPTEFWVTIPEGLRREEIAIRFAIVLNKETDFIDEFLRLTVGKEGYLYPDTYLFPKSASATQVVNRLTTTFDQKVKNATKEQVIMASLLERETFTNEEKPVVAGVLYKRLENGWPLQIDATLQYAKDNIKYKNVSLTNKYWDPAYAQDKGIESPFNTYKNLGLPPAPIANPGASTINAVINSVESEYWYYIHDNSGKIHYARTLDEHNQNINRYLR
ncbi:MAG: endolytic transglycosylase MltG [bacterium]|nr:MAG: endolytic transglycosylase MltG [bacterium]